MVSLKTLLLSLITVTVVACGGDDYSDRMMAEHEGETPIATPATSAVDGVVGGEVEYPIGDGNTATGYLAKPANAPDAVPGVIVIHEWWGLNDNIRNMADQLAAEGYAALAVDLYGGEVATSAEKARELVQMASSDTEAVASNLEGAHRYLAETVGSPRVGAIGWCFGGGMVLRAAIALPDELDAAVVYYGRPVENRDELATIGAPVLGHFGAEDQGIPVESARQFEQTMLAMDKDVVLHVYENAGHAFANPSGERYHSEAAELAWERTKAFLAEHLGA